MLDYQIEIRVHELGKAFPDLANNLQHAFNYTQSDPGSSLTKSRMVLEQLLLDVYASEMGKEPKRPLLKDLLTDNQFTRKLDKRIVCIMDNVRNIANLGAHPGATPRPRDAWRTLDDMCEVLDWHRQHYPRATTPPNGQVQDSGDAVRGDRAVREATAGRGDEVPPEMPSPGKVAVAADKPVIEVSISTPWSEFTMKDQAQFLQRLGGLLGVEGIQVILRQPGSVRLGLTMTGAQAERLRQAVMNGALAEFKVVGASSFDDELAYFYAQADPLADEAAAALGRLPAGRGRRALDTALSSSLSDVRGVPRELRALFAQVEYVPPWVSWEQIGLGGATYRRCGVLGGFVLASCALPISYSLAAGNKPLVFSGRLEQRSERRLTETARFVFQTCQPGQLRCRAAAWQSTVKVRLMHAQIRRLLKQSGRWNPDWGEPINQVYLAHTNLIFSVSQLDHLRRIGFHFSRAEAEAVMQLWRYSGYLLGIEPALLCATEDEGRRLMRLIERAHQAPDRDSQKLTEALMVHALPKLILAGRPGSERHRPRLARCCYGISQALIGSKLAQQLGYPPTLWRHVACRLAWLIIKPIEFLRRIVPGLHAPMVALGTRMIEQRLRANPGPSRPDFQMPPQLDSTVVNPTPSPVGANQP